VSPKDFLLKLKIFALVILPLTKIAGQNLHENLIFESFNEEISTRAISVITKDDKGIVWIGTQGDGLSSFNGYEFKQYKHDWDNVNTLDNSVVNSIFIDSYKNLWVGTQEGLNLYNRDLDHFIQIKLDSLDSKIPVKTINETDDKKLLIGTHGYGAFALDIKSMKCQIVNTYFLENIKNFQINNIKTTSRGATLIGTNKGLYKYNIQTNELIPAKFTTLKGSETINSSIQSITTKKDGSIWLGTENNGLIEVFINPTNYYEFKTHEITNKRILSLEIDKNGSLFCGTENDGLFIIDKKKNFHSLKHDKSNTKGIKSNSIWSIYVDEKNRIWVGYFNQGIDIYDKDKQRFKSIESIPNKDQSLFSNSVTAITQDKFGKLYFGIGDGGIDVYDPEKNNFTHLIDQSNPIAKGLTSKDVVTVFTDSKNNLWVGTWNSSHVTRLQ
jgi:ligand-binding sensor domain-containing protein